MRVYEGGDWTIESVGIRQDYAGSHKTQFFVDDRTGKNHAVFNTKEEALEWVAKRGRINGE